MADKIKSISNANKGREKLKKEIEIENNFAYRKRESNELSQINEGEYSKEYDQSNFYDSELIRRSSSNSNNIESSLNETGPFTGKFNNPPILSKASSGSVNTTENDMKFIMKTSIGTSNNNTNFSNRFNENLKNSNDDEFKNPFNVNSINNEINDNLNSNDMINLNSHFSNKNFNTKPENYSSKNNENNNYKNKILVSAKQTNKNQMTRFNTNPYNPNNNFKDDKHK